MKVLMIIERIMWTISIAVLFVLLVYLVCWNIEQRNHDEYVIICNENVCRRNLIDGEK